MAKKRERIEITSKDAALLLSMAGQMEDELVDYYASMHGKEKAKRLNERWQRVRDRMQEIADHSEMQ